MHQFVAEPEVDKQYTSIPPEDTNTTQPPSPELLNERAMWDICQASVDSSLTVGEAAQVVRRNMVQFVYEQGVVECPPRLQIRLFRCLTLRPEMLRRRSTIRLGAA